MTLPSTSTLPSPVMPAPHPSSGHKGSPNAPVHKRGGQPGNQNARKLCTFSRYQPGSLRSTRAFIKDLRIRLRDPSGSLVQIVEDARTAGQELPIPQSLPTPISVDEFIPALELSIKLTSVVFSAWAECIPLLRLSDALESIAHDPFG